MDLDMGPKLGGEESREDGLDERMTAKALELFRRLENIAELPKFDGACVDFHKKKPAVVFIPWVPMVAQVSNGELPAFLVSHGVRRVLVDAMWPGNVGILMELVESGIEVWVLTRASALHGWRRKGSKRPKGLTQWLRKWHPEVLRGFVEEIKKDAYDAVLLRYVKRRYMMKVTKEYLECWVRMILWRRARREHQRLLNQLSSLPIAEDERRRRIGLSKAVLIEEARNFVEAVRRHYPVDQLFRRFGIEDDLIAQAYCCEIVIEAHGSRTLAEFLRKLGLSPGNEDNEDDGRRRKKSFIYDKRARFSLNRLVLKVYRFNPKREQNKVKGKCMKVAEEVWRWRTRCLEAAQPGGGYPE